MKRLCMALLMSGIVSIAFGQDDALQYYYRGEYTKANPLLINLAKNNNAQALYCLANMNLFGYGMPKNPAAGLDYMKRSAELKNLPASLYLGAYYLNDKQDLAQALIWLQKAADLGDVKAQMYTALSYLNGLGTKPNPDLARQYIIKAALNGVPMAQYILAKIFLQSRHPGDNKMGKIWLTKAAAQNFSDAQALLNKLEAEKLTSIKKEPILWIDEHAQPVPTLIGLLKKANMVIANPNRSIANGNAETKMPTLQPLPESAIIQSDFNVIAPENLPIRYILVQLSRLNYAKAKYNEPQLTYTFQLPKGAKDYQQAFAQLSNEAKYGNAHTLFELALMYKNGLGVEKNSKKAFELFKEIADTKYQKAEYMVGLYYLNGWIVEQDKKVAMQWLLKSALHGNAYAQLLLGSIYENQKNYMHAKAMYSLSAQNNIALAQYRLANMYASGVFNPENNFACVMPAFAAF